MLPICFLCVVVISWSTIQYGDQHVVVVNCVCVCVYVYVHNIGGIEDTWLYDVGAHTIAYVYIFLCEGPSTPSYAILHSLSLFSVLIDLGHAAAVCWLVLCHPSGGH